jgi:hypothetical protein
MSQLTGLIAYPSNPNAIGDGLHSTLELLRNEGIDAQLSAWDENDIPGRFIVTPVLQAIEGGNLLIADITRLNFNVTFEIGYAIGRRKRTVLIKNTALTGSDI